MATPKPRRLGRGLSSLIQTSEPIRIEKDQTKTEQLYSPVSGGDSADADAAATAVGGLHGTTGEALVRWVAVDRVTPSPYQPRRHFEEEALAQLAASITRSGLMQPIIVRPAAGGYELVAGERRWRAAGRAGLSEIPAVVRELGDEDAAEWALVENLQREELDPIERAHGLRSLAERFGVSHAELGERVGLDRSTVANLIRLTELESEIQNMVASGALTMGHARALLGVSDSHARCTLATRAVAESWSVRKIEEQVRRKTHASADTNDDTRSSSVGQTQRQAVIADIERRLSAHLGTKTRVTMRSRGNRGRLTIDFYSLEEFEGLMERLGLADETTG